jgi:hypothetical protein
MRNRQPPRVRRTLALGLRRIPGTGLYYTTQTGVARGYHRGVKRPRHHKLPIILLIVALTVWAIIQALMRVGRSTGVDSLAAAPADERGVSWRRGPQNQGIRRADGRLAAVWLNEHFL